MTSVAILRPLHAIARTAIELPISILARIKRVATPSRLKKYDRLHLGSGERILDGWANIDISGLRTITWDLRKPLPLAKGQVRFVYTEHFVEHIEREDAVRLLSRVRGAMAQGGVLRVSTPDLAKLVADYQAGHVIKMEHGGWFPETPCRMINEGMRYWGHVFVYDEPELVALLKECGFSDIRRVKWGESDHPELRNLESRPDFADLIFEATA
jgi:predicted SAM-dependent methyltransferase